MINIFKNIFRKKNLTTGQSVEEVIHIDNSKKSIDEIIQGWRHTDLKLNGPATADLISDTQKKIEYTFPDDFLNFYKILNGFKDWDVIGETFCIWTLERITEEYEKSEDKNFVPSCDYLIDSHRLGYLKDEFGIYKDYYDQKMYKIADTLEDTIRLILAGSELLY
jgi:hypothetical protein